jgi:hypothetical protein
MEALKTCIVKARGRLPRSEPIDLSEETNEELKFIGIAPTS